MIQRSFYQRIWKNYFSFQGSITVSEYRKRFAYIHGFCIASGGILCLFLLPFHFMGILNELFVVIPVLILAVVYNFLLIWSMIALSIKRLHDLGRSGYWLFSVLVPVVGILLLSYLLISSLQLFEQINIA